MTLLVGDIKLTMTGSNCDNEIKSILGELSKEFDLRAVIGYGSFFRNESQENSDIDLLVLSVSSIHQKYLLQRSRVFEVNHFGLKRFNRLLENLDKCYVPALANGKVIYDKNDTAKMVIRKARALYNLGPQKIDNQTYLLALQSKINTLYNDLKDSHSNTFLFDKFYISLIESIYVYICYLKNDWRRSDKQMLNHLFELSPLVYKDINSSISSPNTHEKFHYIEKILKDINLIILSDFRIDYSNSRF